MCTHVSIIKREKRKEKGRGGSKPPTDAQYTVNTKHNGTEVFLNLSHMSISMPLLIFFNEIFFSMYPEGNFKRKQLLDVRFKCFSIMLLTPF